MPKAKTGAQDVPLENSLNDYDGKVVKVTWFDAAMEFEVDKEHIQSIGLQKVTTYGLLVHRNKQFLAVAQEELEGSYRSVTIIPKCLVFQISIML